MNEYIIYPDMVSATNLITQINNCMGWPDDGTDTWMIEPDWMCEFNLETGDKTSMGYGVEIQDRIKGCLTPQQLDEVFTIPSNINTCSWNPI